MLLNPYDGVKVDQIYDIAVREPIPRQVINTGVLTASATTILARLDAFEGIKKDVKIALYIDAVLAANITFQWYLTSLVDPTTFVVTYPAYTAHTPAAATVELYEFGDVPEGLMLEARVLAAAIGAAKNYESILTYNS